MDEEKLNVIVERIYEAAARPGLWRQALHELALASNALGAQLLHHRPEGAALHTNSEGLDEVVEAFFREGWHVRNPREVRARRRGVAFREVVTDADLFTREELDREPWQRDFLDRYGLRWFSSFGTIRPEDLVAPVILTIERPAAREPFSRKEVGLLRTIVPHVQRAGQLSLAVAAAAGAGLLEGLERAGRAAALLDDIGDVTGVNASLEQKLGDGLSLRASRFVADFRPANAGLQALIASVTAPPPYIERPALNAVLIPRRKRRPLIAQAAPLVNSARDFFQQARALIVFMDLDERRAPDVLFLSAAFDLTAMEARLAQALVEGRRLAEFASDAAISINTARTHLKGVFAKTDTHSQTELALILSRIAKPPEA